MAIIARVVSVEVDHVEACKRYLNERGIKFETQAQKDDKSETLIMFVGTQRDVNMVEELGNSIDLS